MGGKKITTETKSRYPGVLLILDGWGLGEQTENNPIYLADTPYFDSLDYRAIEAVGPVVGMPEDAKGSTAVGHEVISGVDYIHPMKRIQKDIKERVFINNLTDTTFAETVSKGGALHLMGLVSNNKEHSDIRHLYALMRRAVDKGIKKIYIHFFSDGRGTPPFSAVRFAEDLIEKAETIAGNAADIKIATVGGRDITMNRSVDSFHKSIAAYRAIIDAAGERDKDIFTVLKKAYDKGITDQYIARIVGATSLRHPPSLSFTLSFETTANGTLFFVWKVDAVPSSVFNTSRLPWSAVTKSIPLFFFYRPADFFQRTVDCRGDVYGSIPAGCMAYHIAVGNIYNYKFSAPAFFL